MLKERIWCPAQATRRSAVWMLAIATLLCPVSAGAQVTGTISGYVRDQGGGVMPGATVTVQSAGQQLVRTAQTNASGFFDLQALPRGRYLVTVEMSGFESQIRKDVEVSAGGNIRLDFELGVGGLTEAVEVAARATMLESRTATQSDLIDDQRVQDLPMNGRNVVALAGTYAGVTNIRANQDTSDGRQGPVMSVNGGNQNHNLFTLNGSVFTHFNQTTGFNPPPPDAVQEIRIQMHNFTAEYGHTAGSQVSIVSKSGSNNFTGTAWEFHRNSELNARSFFQTRKPEQKQNQAGASAGGAIVPNKLFWFGSFQRLWDRREAGSSQTTVPTDAQRAGNFTGLSTQLRNPVNPITGAAFTNSAGQPCIAVNVINPGCISPVARNVLDQYVPRSPDGTFVTLSPSPRDHAVYMGRVDYHVNANNQLNAHYFADRSDSSSWPGNVNYVQQQLFSDVDQFGISDSHIFGPRLLNEATFSYLSSRSGGGAVTQILPRDLGVNVDLGPDGRGMSLSVSGGINLSYPGINAQDYESWQVKDTMTFSTGNHTVKWGYELIKAAFEFNLALNRTANFQGTRTGNPYADFMVGAFENATVEFGIADHSPSTIKHQFFVEDSYRAHPRLTLNYGLRYEPFIPWDQLGGRHTSWIPGVQSTVVPDAPTGLLFPGDPELPERLTYSDLNNFAPRFGAAWDVTGNARTVVRGGYGLFYQQVNGETTHAAEGPWRGTTQLRQGRIEDPFGSLGQVEPPPESPGRFGCSPIDRYPGLRCTEYPLPIRTVYTDPHLRTTYTHHVSTSVQRQVTGNLAVEASYIGKIGRKLVGHNYFNAAPYINSPITGLPPSLQNVEERVPFSPGIISAQSRVLGNFFRSTYHSLQLRVERRFARTFSFSGSYALSKNMTNQPENTTGLISNIPNPFDLESLWGPSFLDRRHVVAASWVWSPQVGLGNAGLRAVLNGWTLTGLHRIQSGGPLAFTMGTDVAQVGTLNTGGQYAMLRPGMTADDVRRDHDSRHDMISAYFNTSAFVPLNEVPRGVFGDARRGLIYGPGDVNTDLAIMRYFSLMSDVRLQVRGEFFNAFNQVNFNNPVTNVSSGNFGRITGAGSGRVVQLAAKLLW
ncbi:MAG: carboxypeptidase regulatory-like domain-containing protein [Acidobacteria bacterium]|nr:carboxypeptidase regulatory-like domain-containing protein [Acidobacteriota bacterium]